MNICITGYIVDGTTKSYQDINQKLGNGQWKSWYLKSGQMVTTGTGLLPECGLGGLQGRQATRGMVREVRVF
uniref:Predicted protein n=1 Tax=Hordeum vulgare subsp. vulgare TaxID=112509 RepID=F2EJE2_HORVV|nr:predicted protein [Hordeum vulgare subsp. vulgare]